MPEPDYDAMSPSDRAFALFTAVEKARSAAIIEMRKARREFKYNEAHQAALAVWNQWAKPLLKEREELKKTGQWSVKNDINTEFSTFIEVGQNPETQDFLRRADINARFITFIGAGWQEANKGDGEDKCFATGTEPPVKTIFCETISLARFSFPGNAYFSGATFNGNAVFSSAKFKGYASFNNATFKGNAYFSSAKFRGNAYFVTATFNGSANFSSTKFKGDASFRSAKFNGNADFKSTQFNGNADFKSAQFESNADLSNAQFEGNAYFFRAQFNGNADFKSAQFNGNADFFRAQFKGNADFFSAQFNGNADFRSAQFMGNADFSCAQVKGNADFRSVQFNGNADFRSAEFKDNAYFFRAQVKDNAYFFSAQFKGNTYFKSAQFKGNADFKSTQFKGNASFKSAQFKGNADLSNAQFKGNADFAQVDFLSHAKFSQTVFLLGSNWTAIDAVRAFNMGGARFQTQVPQFTQAHFTESPRVGNIDLPLSGRGHDTLPAPKPETGWVTKIHSWGWAGGERQDETGNDTYHTPYQTKLEELLKNEELGDAPKGETHQEMMRDGKRYRVRQRNIPLPKPGKPIDKDDIAAFTALRRIAKQGEDHETERKAFKGEMRTRRVAGGHNGAYRLFSWAYDLFTDFGGSFLRPLLLWLTLSIASMLIYTGAATSPVNKTEQATCSHPLTHASLLSARNALLFATAGQRPFVTKSLDCLYGKEPKEQTVQHPTRTGPPQWLGLFGTVQTLLSAILIFFILLALRNRFKI